MTSTEQKHPDSSLIVLGDFDGANLSHELPKHRQCPTRDKNKLGHCTTILEDTYHFVPSEALRL